MMTPQTPQLNDSDLELLSAYLDGQMDSHDRAALEARLAQEPELRQALAELRGTVTLLRNLPPMRPPRSFTLDPATVTKPHWWRLTQWMQIGSGVAALLLVLSFAGSLFPSRGFGSAAAPAPMMQEAPAAGGAAAEMANAPTEQPAAAASSMMRTATTPDAEGIPNVGASAADAANPDATAEATASGMAAADTANPDATDEAAASILSAAPPSSVPDENSTAEATVTAPTSLKSAESPTFSTFQIIQLVLALLAIGLFVSALILKRRNHP